MSETNNQTLDQAIDPPENQGGTQPAVSFDSSTPDQTAPVDPPDNNGGTGG